MFYLDTNGSEGHGEGDGEPEQRGHIQTALGHLRQAACSHGETQARESGHASRATSL